MVGFFFLEVELLVMGFFLLGTGTFGDGFFFLFGTGTFGDGFFSVWNWHFW